MKTSPIDKDIELHLEKTSKTNGKLLKEFGKNSNRVMTNVFSKIQETTRQVVN